MLKKTLFLVIVSVQILYSQSIESILKLIDTNNYILKAKEIQITSSLVDADLSSTWSNPVLGIGVSDINLDEPTSRDIEAMQTQYITYSQVIPTNGKLKLSNEIKQYDTKINKLEYLNYKQKLQSEALLYSYNIFYNNEKLTILKRYLKNLQHQKKLMNLLYENGKLDQSILVTQDIKIYKLNLKKQKFIYTISKMKKSLEDIVYTKIDTITFDDFFGKFSINMKSVLENHPLVLMEKEKIKQQTQKIALENSKKISDVKLTVGYYQREKFDDYISFNIAIPLSIQGREKLQVKKSKIEKNIIQDKLRALQQQIKSTIEDLEENIKLNKQNFTLIDEKMIPLNDGLEQTHKLHLGANTMQSIKIYESMNSKLELMLLSQEEKINYYSALSKLYYFKGEL